MEFYQIILNNRKWRWLAASDSVIVLYNEITKRKRKQTAKHMILLKIDGYDPLHIYMYIYTSLSWFVKANNHSLVAWMPLFITNILWWKIFWPRKKPTERYIDLLPCIGFWDNVLSLKDDKLQSCWYFLAAVLTREWRLAQYMHVP